MKPGMISSIKLEYLTKITNTESIQAKAPHSGQKYRVFHCQLNNNESIRVLIEHEEP